MKHQNRLHVVIIGGGFGGLYAAKALRRSPVDVTLIDRRNFHLFQPLLYQVATGGISPGDIASPLRAVLHRQKNTRVIQAEVVDIDRDNRKVLLHDGAIHYDKLIVATGVCHYYFGNDSWPPHAPGLKSIEDALDIRRRIFLAFETAEREPDPLQRQAWQTFVVIGAGPTGVELSGALGELAHRTLRDDFQATNTHDARILLVEGADRVLPGYPPDLSAKATASLSELGVTIRTRTRVTNLSAEQVTLQHEGSDEIVAARTTLWAAGVKGSPLGTILAERAGASLDGVGRVMVAPDMTVPGSPDIFVVGDLAHFAHQGNEPLPGVAQVAMQQGDYVARLISGHGRENVADPFHYKDKGSLAVIGRNRAVANIFGLHLSGFLAWLIWVFIHIAYLIEFDNRLLVIMQWATDYFTRKRGARLITGDNTLPKVGGTITDQTSSNRSQIIEKE